jgi:hypothetical protein
MDNTATAAVGYRDNAPIFRPAVILFSLGRSMSVGGSDIGPKILNTLDHRNPPRTLGVKKPIGSFPVDPIRFASPGKEKKGERNGRTKGLEKLVARTKRLEKLVA